LKSGSTRDSFTLYTPLDSWNISAAASKKESKIYNRYEECNEMRLPIEKIPLSSIMLIAYRKEHGDEELQFPIPEGDTQRVLKKHVQV
jgi:hypothetical protein